MCSIAGYISSKPLDGYAAQRLCRALLYHGSSRGNQSAGIWANETMYKRAQSPKEFVHTEAFQKMFDVGLDMVLLHTRMPTSGGTGDEQAHPFWIGNTVTVHNGHISNIEAVKTKWQIDKPSGVDSELFAAGIDKLGIDKLEEFARDVQGSAALAIWHEGELYLCRDNNPLEYYHLQAYIESGEVVDVMVFGSTEKQVVTALHHTWLLDSHVRTTTLPEYKCVRVNAKAELTNICSFRLSSQRYSGWRSTYDLDDEGYESSRSSYSNYNSGSGEHKPSLTTWRGADGQTRIKLGGTMELTAMDVLELVTDPTIEDKSPHETWRGWGWKRMPIPEDLLLPGTNGQRFAYEYDYQYGIKQRIKFGDMKYVLELAKTLVQSDELWKNGGPAPKKEPAKKKRKKDRNRNANLKLLTGGSRPAK